MERSLSNVGASAPQTTYPTHPDDYELKAEIGKGAFATVWLAFCKPVDEYVAIKILDLEELETSWEEIRKEIAVMGLLNHPNVVRCLCSFVVDQEIWLVMPLLSSGSCADIIKRNFPKGINDEALIATILREALQGLMYLHKDGRIHRDVKAGNILISNEGQVQIADFGVAGTLVESGDRRRSRKTFVGTPCWMAPEVMEQTSGYDQKADMWSFGITALELAFGRPPYAQYQPMKVMILTLQEEPPSSLAYQDNQKKFSRSFKSMVAACLKKEPSKRLTAEKLLQHKFFKQGKNSAFIVETLLSQIPRPKWNKEALVSRSRGASVSSLPKEPAAEQPIVSSWVFDDEKLRSLKNDSADVKEDTRTPEPLTFQSVPPSAAPASSEKQIGRFTVMVTDVSEDVPVPAQVEAAEQPAQPPTQFPASGASEATSQTQRGRFAVTDVHEDDG